MGDLSVWCRNPQKNASLLQNSPFRVLLPCEAFRSKTTTHFKVDKKVFKPNSKRSSRCQGDPFRKEVSQFHPSLISLFLKNTTWTLESRTNLDRKRIEGGFLKLRLTVKAKALIHLETPTRSTRCGMLRCRRSTSTVGLELLSSDGLFFRLQRLNCIYRQSCSHRRRLSDWLHSNPL